jgi:hypothetical protein
MGRQIQIHALPSDINSLINAVYGSESVEMALWSGNTTVPERIAFLPDNLTGKMVALWTDKFAPDLQRKYVARAQPPHHAVDVSAESVLELSLSALTSWNESEALTQGRIYAIFEGKEPGFEKWYDRLVRHIRRHWRQNPAAWMGGYLGPAAAAWFERGGLLLPSYIPPVRNDWVERLSKQHPA